MEKRMKRALIALGLVTLAALPASAADLGRRLPTKAPPMAAEPVWNWTGFYIGANGGFGWATSNHTDLAGVTSGDLRQSGGMIGGTVGYNWQTGPAVFGVEGDLDWAHINGNKNCGGANCFTNMQAFGTARGRLGYAFNNWMPFITGGAAFADVSAGQSGIASAEQWRTGWTIGGGVEAMFAPNWSAKVEYLYADFGTGAAVSYNAPGVVGVTERNVNMVRGGINYHFNWGGPVVARY
jgi:outer membrane immunogenic protein